MGDVLSPLRLEWTAVLLQLALGATDALGCGDLADLRADARDPLTPGRFLHNMVDSVRLNGVRVPSDPAAARDRFCG